MSLVPPQFDHASFTYLTVYLRSSSSYLTDPQSIRTIHPALTHVGQVGVMKDVLILSVPVPEWSHVSADVLALLSSQTDIAKVEVQGAPKARVKRGGDL